MASREKQRVPPPHEPDAHHVAMVMDAFGRLSDLIVAKTIAQYKSMRSHVDLTRWQPIQSERGIHLYQERSAMNTQRDGVEPAMTNSWSNRSNYHHRHRDTRDRRDRSTSFTRFATSRVNAMATGHIRGRLDTVMAGLYADTSEDMRWNCAVQHGDDSLVGCGIVRTMEAATAAQPYRYVGIKWLERVCSRSFVTDQLFWLERMGLFTDPITGQKFGYQLLKSIDLDVHDRSASELPTRRVNVSLCYVYCQSAPDVVSLFTRGLVEIPTQIDQDENEVVQVAAHYILASIRGKECRQIRQISKLLRQSSDDTCSYCRHTVDSPHNAVRCLHATEAAWIHAHVVYITGAVYSMPRHHRAGDLLFLLPA